MVDGRQDGGWTPLLDRRRWLAAAGATALSTWGFPALAAPRKRVPVQPRRTPLADPRYFELDIEDGPVRPGNGRRITCRDGDKEVVARLFVEVGKSRVAMLPSGRLTGILASQTALTEKPFVPATMDEVAKELLSKQFAGFRTRHTRRYLHIYNTSDLFHTAASRILETMFPGVSGYAKGQKITVTEPEVPLVVIGFATEQEFQAFQPMSPGVAAYFSPVSNFVVMYEQPRRARLPPELAAQQSISTIAHEGAHQILHNIGVQQRMSRWPMWACEGLAEYFAPTTTDKRMTWKGAGQLNDLRLGELDQYLRRRPPNARGDLVEHTVEAADLTSTGYASAWALTHFLVRRQPAKFFGYLKELSRLGPFEGGGRVDETDSIAENKVQFVKHFGADMNRLETQVVEHLQKLLAG